MMTKEQQTQLLVVIQFPKGVTEFYATESSGLRGVSVGLIFFSSVGVMPVTFLNCAERCATLL